MRDNDGKKMIPSFKLKRSYKRTSNARRRERIQTIVRVDSVIVVDVIVVCGRWEKSTKSVLPVKHTKSSMACAVTLSIALELS